ncbi:MAG TPA: serine/threonine-protein kinase [Thermoanaerobaculia bacterium]|nr:serine/threonine-protein kinase [Thermoanaerobaculia bacterium]
MRDLAQTSHRCSRLGPGLRSLASPGQAPVRARFVLVARAGSGGMGEVYRAWDRRDRRFVAIKLLHDDGPAQQERLFREARLLATLQHPHIRHAHECGRVGRRPYLAMEWVEGPTLKAAAAGLTRAERLCLAVQIGEAVAFAHAHGVLHRDLKPANVLVGRDGRGHAHAYLIDFGIAAELDQPGGTRPGLLLGTPAYLAPEQIGGGSADQRTDVWGFGALLYETLTGRPPFGEGDPGQVLRRVLTTNPIRPRRFDPELAPELEALILRCLEKRRERRYSTIQAIVDDLETWT